MKKSGQSLIELLVAVGVAAIFLPALALGLVASRNGRVVESQRIQAVALLKEAKEAVRTVREADWTDFASLSGTGNLYPAVSGSSWILSNNPAFESVSGFKRHVVISDVCRDTDGAITGVCGSNDPSTKKVVATVSWTSPYQNSVTTTFYLTRLTNSSYTETKKSEFDNGTVTSVKTQASVPPDPNVPGDGEIVLSQTGGFGDWCNPSPTPITQLDLSGQGVPNAISATQGSGNVISTAAEGGNASGVTLAGINISDPQFPTAPLATVAGVVSNNPVVKTNGVFNEVNYGYLAADHHGKDSQGIIVDITNYTEVGTLDLNNNANGQSVYVLNNYAYLTASDGYLYIFDVTTRPGSHSPIPGGRIQLAGVGKKIIVLGTNAYVATTSTTYQLQIVNVQNPSSPSIAASISVGNGKGATDVFVNQTQLRAYLVTAYASTTTPDFFTININPTDSWYKQVVNTFITQNNMSPTGVVAVSGSRAIIVGTGSTRNYQVIALSAENVPPPALSTCGTGGLDTTYNINAVATLFTAAKRAYSYVITNDSRKEFKIIEGGPGAGNGNYVPTGTFISQPFGPTASVAAFNNFVAHISQPQPNNVQIYVAAADPDSNNSCTNANYTFIGINGTPAPFQTSATQNASISGTIPFSDYPPTYENPNKCFKYKVVLNTADAALTPIFKDLAINYSP